MDDEDRWQAELERLQEAPVAAAVALAVHELRTNYTALIGFLTLLQDGSSGPVPEPMVEFLAEAMAAARRINAIVDTVLLHQVLCRLRSEEIEAPPALETQDQPCR